ncbi:hypothetical protein QT21_00205 [Staphylococcus aureus]|nr:hypothetical protein QT21_00205 [Staphylococcus aureus]
MNWQRRYGRTSAAGCSCRWRPTAPIGPRCRCMCRATTSPRRWSSRPSMPSRRWTIRTSKC